MEFPARPFVFAELHLLGITRTDLRRGLDSGQVRRVVRGVYAPASLPDDPESRLRAIGLALRPGQVACDRTAAWIHGVDLFGSAEHETVPNVETCALRGDPRSRLVGVRGRTRDLAPHDVMELSGIQTTTPLRTALDLGCVLHRRDALAALDNLRRLHGLTREDLLQELPRYHRRRGVVQLRLLVTLSDDRAESVRESWMRLAIHDAGLPRPQLQVWVEVDGRPTYRLDLAYPASRVAVEYDGAAFHSSPEQRRHDEERRELLREQGWTVIVVRVGDFTGDRLTAWTADVRRALESAYCNRRW